LLEVKDELWHGILVTGSSSDSLLSELEISLLLAAIDEAEHFEKE